MLSNNYWKAFEIISGSVTFISFLFVGFFATNTNSTKADSEKNDSNNRLNLFDWIISIIAGIIFMTLLSLTIWHKIFPVIGNLLLLLTPFTFLVNAVITSDSISEIVFDKKEKSVSLEDYYRVEMFCMSTLFLLSGSNVEKIMGLFSPYCKDSFLKAVLLESLICIYLFTHIFILLINLIFPLKVIIRRIKRHKGKIIKGRREMLDLLKLPKFGAGFSKKYYYKWKASKIPSKILYFGLMVFSPCVDILINLWNMTLIILLYQPIVYILEMLFVIFGYLYRLLKASLELPLGKIISNSFRASSIIAITTVVIMFRINNELRLAENNLAILEFVASVIVIPTIFEWIYSSKRKDGKIQ